MAEALAKHHWANTLKVASAGLTALGYIPEETLRVLEEIGISTDGLYSKGLNEVELEKIDLVLDLAAYPLEDLIPPPFQGKLIHWYVRDPFQENLDAFRQTRNAIEWLVTEKLPNWLDEDL